MACCTRLAPALFLHINLLLAVYAGGCLASAARLKWDPSTYAPLRALFPAEYRAAAVLLAAAGAALLALGHLAALALRLRPTARRNALILYAVCMTALVCAEAAWLAWSGARVAAWLRSERAAQILEVLELREHLQPVLSLLARWHPLPDSVRELIAEAEADAPRNLYAAACAAALLALLQAAAAPLALLAAARSGPPPELSTDSSLSNLSTDHEKAPLKTAFRNGKLVIV